MQEQLGDPVISFIFALSITLGQSLLLRFEWTSITAAGAVVGCIGYTVIGTVTALGVSRDQYFYLPYNRSVPS